MVTFRHGQQKVTLLTSQIVLLSPVTVNCRSAFQRSVSCHLTLLRLIKPI